MATCKNFHSLNTVEIDHDEFNCPVCLDIFETPKSLPNCAHKICKPCLLDFMETNEDNEELQCPICRQKSPLPSKGVDGFPTDTFLVRCIEKIPGVSEKREIKHAVSECKKEIEKKQNLRETFEKQLEIVEQNRKLGEELKKQISSHSCEVIKSVKKQEEDMCKFIDDLVNNDFGVTSRNKLERGIKTLGEYLEMAQNCVLNAEETLNSGNINEIIEMKEVIRCQLLEYSDEPFLRLPRDVKSFKPFDVTFKTSEVNNNSNFLGKLIRNGRQVNELSQPQTSSRNSAITTASTSSLADSGDASEVEDVSAPVANVLHTVKLSFCPTRIAVSRQSYDIALLWKEQRKVLIYSSNAEYKGVIKVVYGNLSDMCFSSIDDHVVILNRESNRILTYTKDGHFLRTKFHVPNGNLKYTFVSSDNHQLIVVSTSIDGDSNADDIDKCIVVHNERNPSWYEVLEECQLNRPVSRAVYCQDKYYIADMDIYGQIVVKVLSSETGNLIDDSLFGVLQHIASIPNTGMVSILHDNFTDPPFDTILVGHPGNQCFHEFSLLMNYTIERGTNPARQWEIIPSEAITAAQDHGFIYFVQVEIYNSQKLFRLVHFQP